MHAAAITTPVQHQQHRWSPVEEAPSGLAVKEGHGQAHDFGQQVGMHAPAGIEGAQHQQQGAPPLQAQAGQPQRHIHCYVSAVLERLVLLLKDCRGVGPDGQPPILANLYVHNKVVKLTK